ncbi:MAG TPA: retropepsin-like aspartic protease [Candidatus Acidoferrales bacterium]|nr:retropepsin-like aspartic protease [Candidatus Acidoferrales bacterium]
MASSSRVAKFVLLCMTLCVMNPVAAQQAMDADALRQRMIEAQGKPPVQYRAEIITSSSATGTFLRREYHRGIDFRIVSGAGPYQRQSGRFEGRDWDQDANGITTIHDVLPPEDRLDQRRVTVTRVNLPVASWRLADLDVHGYGLVQYIDPSTYHLVRTEVVSATGTVTTVYDDFRTVHGYTAPYHWITDDTTTGDHSDANMITFEATPITDADLAIPPSRDFVIFPAGGAPVTLPTNFNPPHIAVRVDVGGHTLKFLLDTSSPGITLDANVAQRLGLINSTQTLLANARRTGAQAIIPEMRVGDLTMHNVVVALGPVIADRQIDTESVGTLGYDFLRSATISIDFPDRKVTAAPSNKFTPPVMTPDSDILALHVIDHQPIVSVTLDSTVAQRMVLDTGAGADLILFDYFTRRYPELFTQKASTPEDPVLYSGAKEPDAKGYRMEEIHFGRYEFKGYDVVSMGALKNYPSETDGLVGPGFIEHFTTSLDLAGGKLYLVHKPGQ